MSARMLAWAGRCALTIGWALLVGCGSLGGERVPSEGTHLHVDLRGQSSEGAVILFLHGGPGSGVSSLLGFKAYSGVILEKQNLLAYLFQRGVIKSPPVPYETQTLAMHIADVDHVVMHLRRKFPHRPLIVIGHSWGGVLALSYLARHPESPVSGLVLVSTPVCLACNEKASYEVALNWARNSGRAQAQRILEAMGPPPYPTLEQMMQQRRLTRRAIPRPEESGSLSQILDAGGYDNVNPGWSQTELRIAQAMYTELMSIDLRPDLPKMTWPLLAIAGGLDGTVMPGPMLKDLEAYGGPKKLMRFEGDDHQPYVQEPQRFSDEVNAFIAGLGALSR